jgi:hypothetical protein
MKGRSNSCSSKQRRGGGGGDFSQASKGGGLKNGSPGVFVSKNGKFAEQGGVLGIDYFSHPGIKTAKKDKLISCNWGKCPNQRAITIQIIRDIMNDHGECFIPWSRGGWIAGSEEKSTLIKLSGYIHVRTGRDGEGGSIYPSEEI